MAEASLAPSLVSNQASQRKSKTITRAQCARVISFGRRSIGPAFG
jgi:hypothetical protein